ncbi:MULTISPECIES: hypothetical protein [Rhodococcus]|uniref:hypothetical protein n=1 Tax=Rhodococcus TaxID=1827 RepID=UPI001F125FDA|nr:MULTISPECIES: hypothetical protein [Rhodococcus]UZG59966.1 hypothetical protein ONE62_40310 [Rhodococcus opacus]
MRTTRRRRRQPRPSARHSYSCEHHETGGRRIISYEAIYDGVRYPLADAAAAHGLEDDIRGLFEDNGNGRFVGFVSQNSTVRLLITPATPIAIRGNDEPNPSVVHRW